MRILYDNFATAAATTISVFSENPLFPIATALRAPQLSKIGKTLSDSAEWIKFDMGSAKACTYAAIMNHNLTAGATVHLQANATDSWGTPSVDSTMTVADFMILNFTETYRWWRITIADASNPDAEIRIGGIYIGNHLDMPGFDPVIPIKRDSTGVVNVSQMGQAYGESRLIVKSIQVTFPDVSDANRVLIDALFDSVNIYLPFILLLWESSLDVQPPVYCRIVESFEWTRAAQTGLSWTTKIGFQECF